MTREEIKETAKAKNDKIKKFYSRINQCQQTEPSLTMKQSFIGS